MSECFTIHIIYISQINTLLLSYDLPLLCTVEKLGTATIVVLSTLSTPNLDQ